MSAVLRAWRAATRCCPLATSARCTSSCVPEPTVSRACARASWAPVVASSVSCRMARASACRAAMNCVVTCCRRFCSAAMMSASTASAPAFCARSWLRLAMEKRRFAEMLPLVLSWSFVEPNA